ncbi:MAG: DUF4335 domain-containing protein [Elainellaceae cyanobacterium]
MPAIRRYSPPTCTLELLARTSPLARWTQRPVWRDITFRLSFDGPHRPTESRLLVQGSDAQLDAVGEVVRSYVQQVLTRSVGQFSAQMQPVSLAGGLAQDRTPNALAVLKPSAQLNHQLQIRLDRPATIELSTLELLDLADALDAYEQEGAIAAPSPSAPAWMRTAAAVVLAVGVTTGVIATQQAVRQNSAPTAESAGDVASRAETERTEESFERDAASNAPEDRVAIAELPQIEAGESLDSDQATPPAPSAAPPPRGTTSADSAPAAPPAASPDVAPGEAANPAGLSAAPSSSPEAAGESIPPELSAIPPIESSEDELAPARPDSTDSNLAEPSSAEAAQDQPFAANRPAPVTPSATVQQVQTAVQSRWQPPDRLRQSLEYRVTVAYDGTLQRVSPIGDTARAYLSTIDALQVGEVVSPPGASSRPIRLVLRRDGQVRAFLEQL